MIEEVTRKGNKERIVEKQVNPDTLKVSDDYFKVELPKDKVAAPVVTPKTKEDIPPAYKKPVG